MREIIVNEHGEVFGDDQSDNYTFSVCVARIYCHLASHDFQEEPVFLVFKLSHSFTILRGYLHAHYKGESGMEVVR